LLATASKLKLESVANDSANSQISQAFYSTKSHLLPNRDDEGSGSMSPTASDMNAPLPNPPPPPHQLPNQLLVLHAESTKYLFSQNNWPALHKDFSSKENRMLHHAYYAKFLKKRDQIKVHWTEKMIESQKQNFIF
jgi:hypothetical protein